MFDNSTTHLGGAAVRLRLAVSASLLALTALVATTISTTPSARAAEYDRAGMIGAVQVQIGIDGNPDPLVLGYDGVSPAGDAVGRFRSAGLTVGPAVAWAGMVFPVDQLVYATATLERRVDDPNDASGLPQWQSVEEVTRSRRLTTEQVVAWQSVEFRQVHFQFTTFGTGEPGEYRIRYEIRWVQEASSHQLGLRTIVPTEESESRCLTKTVFCWRLPGEIMMS